MHISRQWFAVVLACTALVGHTASTADSPPPDLPRLWKAQRTEADGRTTVFYLLAGSHAGLPAEYGPYFDNVVLPAFDTSDDLGYEGAIAPAPDAPRPTCAYAPLDADAQARLARVREIVAQRLVKVEDQRSAEATRGALVDPRTEAQRNARVRASVGSIDEFDLVMTYIVSGLSVNEDVAMPPQKARPPSIDVTATLHQRRTGLPIYDVDRDAGERRAYCRAGAQRVAFLEMFIGGYHASATQQLSVDEIYVRDLHAQAPVSPFPPTLNRPLICDRSQEWADAMAARHDGGTHFLVLGAAHFFDMRDPGNECPGVLADLRRAGLAPTLLER